MSRIKLIGAEFCNSDRERRVIVRRLARFLKERRAQERGTVPPDGKDLDAPFGVEAGCRAMHAAVPRKACWRGSLAVLVGKTGQTVP